jgi:hypothetical protein
MISWMNSAKERKVIASFIMIMKKTCNMLCGKGRVRTQDLGYHAERYDHCATLQLNSAKDTAYWALSIACIQKSAGIGRVGIGRLGWNQFIPDQ